MIDLYLVGLPNLLSWILIAIFHAWPWKTHTHTQINNNKKLSMIKWQIYLDVSMHTLPTRRLCPTHAMIPQRRDWALDCLLSTNQQEFSQRSIRYLIWTWSHPQLCMCSNGSEIHIVNLSNKSELYTLCNRMWCSIMLSVWILDISR